MTHEREWTRLELERQFAPDCLIALALRCFDAVAVNGRALHSEMKSWMKSNPHVIAECGIGFKDDKGAAA